MKKLILPFVALLLGMAACQKEDSNLLTLEVEHYNGGAKMHIDNRDFAVWDDGDTVWLNENPRRVTVNNATQRATIDISDIYISAPYYATYPYFSEKVKTVTAFNISLPAVQTYRENSQGRQIVAAPMLAYTPDVNGTLKFRNVGSVLAVKVLNNTYDMLRVHSISVTADNQNLWGNGRINIINDSSVLSSTSLSNGGRSVTLKCEGGVEVPAGGKVFYIALPVISGAHLTVKVDDGYGIYTLAQTTNTASFYRNTLHQVPFSASEDICVDYDERPQQDSYTIRYSATSRLTDFEEDATVWGKTVLSHDYNATSKKGTITFNSEITELPDDAFLYKDALLSIELPESVETIGADAFWGCRNLASVSVPGVKTVGGKAFAHCYALTTLNLPSVTRIDGDAFLRAGIQTIIFGPNLNSLGVAIFNLCENINDIYCKAQSVPESDVEIYEGTAEYGRNCWYGMDCSPILHVPIGTKEAYCNNQNWIINHLGTWGFTPDRVVETNVWPDD